MLINVAECVARNGYILMESCPERLPEVIEVDDDEPRQAKRKKKSADAPVRRALHCELAPLGTQCG